MSAAEPHFKVLPEFVGASYCRRYELLLHKLISERHYDAAAFLTSKEKGGDRGQYTEPADDLTMKRLLASLAGHVDVYLAGMK